MTAFAIAVAAAVVGAEVAPFWTGEATIGGASTIDGIGVPAHDAKGSMLCCWVPLLILTLMGAMRPYLVH